MKKIFWKWKLKGKYITMNSLKNELCQKWSDLEMRTIKVTLESIFRD